MADGASSKVAVGVSSKVADGVTKGCVSRNVAGGVASNVADGVVSKVADGVTRTVAGRVTSEVAGKECSEVADRRGRAAEAASVVEEMCSPSGIPADQIKKEAVRAVSNNTGHGTKEKSVKWTSEALRAAQDTDSEIKPILEWKKAFQDHQGRRR